MSDEKTGGSVRTVEAQNKRLRIAVLSRNFAPTAGGAERYAIAMVEQLALRHDITVFAQTIAHSWPGVTYRKVSEPLTRPRWINQLWFATATWWATRRGFDIVHSHENTWHGNVQTVHVMPVRHNLFKNWAQRSITGQLVIWLRILTSPRLMVYLTLEQVRYRPMPARRVVVTSRMLLDIFKHCFPKAAGMTSVVTPGIHLAPADRLLPNQAEARRLSGLPQSGPCLLFVGNDFKKKGLPVLMQALKKLPGDVMLAVAGNSAQTGFFKQQATAIGLQSRVFFLGALVDMAPAYLAATCLVHPTREDTFAMVVLEAMAFGLPIIVSDARYCGISSLLEHNKNALLVSDPYDPDEVARLISRVLADEVLKAGLQQHARAFAESFDWPVLAAQQEAIYFECARINRR